MNKLSFPLKKNGTQPLYQQIADAVSIAIIDGQLKPGDPLPSTREMASTLQVHRKTVVEAYEQLASKKLIYTATGKGTFVSDRTETVKNGTAVAKVKPILFNFNEFTAIKPAPEILQQHWDVKFDDGLPDPNLAPVKELTTSYKRIFYQKMRMKKADIMYGSEGHMQALDDLNKMMRDYRGIVVDEEHFCVILGNSMALYMVAQTLLKAGDCMAIESPCNVQAWEALRRTGNDIFPVSTDSEGIITEELELLCNKKKIKAVYLNPQGQYPTTVKLSESRRAHLLALARRYKFAVVEADSDYEYHYTEQATPMIAGNLDGSVIYISGMSKMVAPLSLITFVIGPAAFIRSLKALWSGFDFQGDAVLEQSLIELMKEGVLTRYVRKGTRIYKTKRDAMKKYLTKYLGRNIRFQEPESGLAFWIEFNKPTDIPAMLESIKKEGVYIPDPNQLSFHTKPLNGLRLGFASLDIARMETGIKAIASALHIFWIAGSLAMMMM